MVYSQKVVLCCFQEYPFEAWLVGSVVSLSSYPMGNYQLSLIVTNWLGLASVPVRINITKVCYVPHTDFTFGSCTCPVGFTFCSTTCQVSKQGHLLIAQLRLKPILIRTSRARFATQAHRLLLAHFRPGCYISSSCMHV